jgi:hypothetical protein
MAHAQLRAPKTAQAPKAALPEGVIHRLYVGEETDGGASLSVLRFLAAHKQTLRQMGICIRATLVRAADLQPRLVAALEQKKITHLPAVLTTQSVYTGAQAILDLYDRNLKAFAAANGGRPPGPRPPAPPNARAGARGAPAGGREGARDPEDPDLEDFLRDSDDEDDLGENANMMDNYRQMVARRDGGPQGPPRPHTPSRAPKNGGAPGGARAGGAPGGARGAPTGRPRAPPSRQPSGRADNVREDSPEAPRRAGGAGAPGPAGGPAGGAAGGARQQNASPFEDEEHDPQDDLMEQAWLANREESLAQSDDEGGVPNDD